MLLYSDRLLATLNLTYRCPTGGLFHLVPVSLESPCLPMNRQAKSLTIFTEKGCLVLSCTILVPQGRFNSLSQRSRLVVYMKNLLLMDSMTTPRCINKAYVSRNCERNWTNAFCLHPDYSLFDNIAFSVGSETQCAPGLNTPIPASYIEETPSCMDN